MVVPRRKPGATSRHRSARAVARRVPCRDVAPAWGRVGLSDLQLKAQRLVAKTLNSDTSRPFEKPKSGRIAVKVINHLGDEVMKVFKV